MANSNNIDGTISTTDTQILSNGLSLPQGFTNLRQPGELEVLIQNKNNTSVLYNQFSYNKTAPTQQRPLLQSSIGTRRSNYQMALNDVVRVKKFSTSGQGVTFLTRQLLLQGLNAFNETKLYNPLDPVLAATSKVTFGLQDAPLRFIEPNLGGVLGALGLGTVSSLFLGKSTPTPPKGTVAGGGIISSFFGGGKTDKLPNWASDGGKGLIRGKTATDANVTFTNKWGNSGGGGFFGALANRLVSIGQSFISNSPLGTFLPVGQPKGTIYKVGDKSYGVFLKDKKNGLFAASLKIGNTWDDSGIYSQKYTAGSKIGGTDNNTYEIVNIDSGQQVGAPNIENVKSNLYTQWVSYQTQPSASNLNVNSGKDLTANDTRQQLESLLTVIQDKGQYQVSMTYNNFVAESYNDLINVKDKGDGLYVGQSGNSPVNYKSNGNLKTYSKNIKNSGAKTLVDLGMDTNTPDTINQLNVLSPDNFYINGGTNNSEKSTGYSPYEDDVIAFYFHDLVNNRYIPFRATIKGLQESLTGEWADIKYINRADKLYSYGGFGRTLGFNFSVVITSIKELLPTWKRINYLAGLTKPANYTKGTVYSRFIIPPLIQFTIGDMYKNQPAVITQIGISIPENAAWETLGEFYGNNNYNWAYLSNTVTWLNSAGLYAQFPNECEITIQMKLLEKELPHTGGSNYGDFYRDVSQRNPIGTSKYGSFSSRLEPTSNTGTPMVEYASTITGGSSQ